MGTGLLNRRQTRWHRKKKYSGTDRKERLEEVEIGNVLSDDKTVREANGLSGGEIGKRQTGKGGVSYRKQLGHVLQKSTKPSMVEGRGIDIGQELDCEGKRKMR